MVSDRRLLIAYAHPDDESFGSGGLIAKYIDMGVDVHLICATDGDQGTIPEAFQGRYETIRELRLAELDCAANKLNLTGLHLFGYHDSGMMGSKSTQDPGCLWYQWQNHPDDVVARIVDVIREVRPQVVLTFNRYGGYGHPDHIAIQQATERAVALAGDPAYKGSDKVPYQPKKFYLSELPRLPLRMLLWTMRLRGQDPRRMGVNQDIDFVKVVENIEPIHARVSIRDYLDAWDEASACHASQGGGTASRFPNWLRRVLFANQGFTRVIPAPNGSRIDERDLFDGVRPEPVQATS